MLKHRAETADLRVLVGIPLERTVSSEAFLCFWEIARRGWPIVHHGYGRTDANRNEIGRTFLESNATHLVMLDLDHLHPPDVIERLLRWVAKDSEKYQVIAGLNYRRGEPYNPCVFSRGPDGALHYPLEWPRGIGQADAVGHGAILIARAVLEKLEPPWWCYEYLPHREQNYPSEDMYFSRLCERAGISLWCDTTLTSPHIAERYIDESDFRKHLAAHPPKSFIENGVVIEADKESTKWLEFAS